MNYWWCFFGIHYWSEISRRFEDKGKNVTEVSSTNTEHLMKILFGFTTVESECLCCGKKDFKVIHGDQR